MSYVIIGNSLYLVGEALCPIVRDGWVGMEMQPQRIWIATIG